MHPSRPDQRCQTQLSNVQTKVLMFDMSQGTVMKTNGAVGNAMLPVALFAANSSSPPIRKTNERVSHAASVTCIRRAHPRLTLAIGWADPLPNRHQEPV
jgi:predicted permease